MQSTGDTRLIVNSVGLRSVGALVGSPRAEQIQALREADYLSVRDFASWRLVSGLGISATLAPDLIQSIRLHRSPMRSTTKYALLQIREADVLRLGVSTVASAIARSQVLSGMSVRLFSAGSARMHDSSELYAEIVRLVSQENPRLDICRSSSLSALDKVDEISGAALWVGTSLHGNIVSSAFNVPRVALDNAKVNRYAMTWEEPMPYGVTWDRLEDAMVSALTLSDVASVTGRATELADLAHKSAIAGVSVLDKRTTSSNASLARVNEMIVQERSARVRRLVDARPFIPSRARALSMRLRGR
ncbi:polysaccharide pyruvyl transferase family protein [Terrabacter sp. 2YAF2]|uniref:polysaccharide pyruvyl transferase family protein n=1 Tax=Terrabacter sp. 2YAF2 TaxID=3233026 RepID=UPI003F945C92